MALITITSLLKQISEKHVNMSYLILIEAYNALCGVPASTWVALTLIDFFCGLWCWEICSQTVIKQIIILLSVIFIHTWECFCAFVFFPMQNSYWCWILFQEKWTMRTVMGKWRKFWRLCKIYLRQFHHESKTSLPL